LMVPGGIAHWREARWKELGTEMRVPAAAAILAGASVWAFTERGTWLTGMGITLATWVVVGLIMQILARLKKAWPNCTLVLGYAHGPLGHCGGGGGHHHGEGL